MASIQTSGLTKRYGDIVAVDDLDLAVEQGEVFGFLGPNGAGKSTTIDVLLGFRTPTAGSATVVGYDATDESRAVRAHTGLLPEGLALYENLTGREHVVSAIETKGADDDPDAVLDRVGLAREDGRRKAGEYSTGMAQRLGLAIALVGQPELLILDEPSSGLDPGGIQRLRTIVREEVERGATVFFSSHILSEVEQVCDRVGILREGRLVAVDDIEGLREQAGLRVELELQVTDVPALPAVRRLPGVADVDVAGNTLTLACTDEDAKMEIINRVDEMTTVENFDTTDSSLETLFEEYTTSDGAGEPVATSHGGT